MRRLDGWLGVLASFIASCGGTESSSTNSDGAVGTTLPDAVCTHLSDKADAAAYLVGRGIYTCTAPEAGLDGYCVGDEVVCPTSTEGFGCHNECEPSEYGLECAFGEPLPPGCRQMTGPAPGGGRTFYCCKCTD